MLIEPLSPESQRTYMKGRPLWSSNRLRLSASQR